MTGSGRHGKGKQRRWCGLLAPTPNAKGHYATGSRDGCGAVGLRRRLVDPVKALSPCELDSPVESAWTVLICGPGTFAFDP